MSTHLNILPTSLLIFCIHTLQSHSLVGNMWNEKSSEWLESFLQLGTQLWETSASEVSFSFSNGEFVGRANCCSPQIPTVFVHSYCGAAICKTNVRMHSRARFLNEIECHGIKCRIKTFCLLATLFSCLQIAEGQQAFVNLCHALQPMWTSER